MAGASLRRSSAVFACSLQVLQSADQEAAGAARRVQHDLAQLRVGHVHHELGHGAGRVVLARIARALQVAQDLLVEVAEEVPVLQRVEVDAVDLVDHLADQRARLHIIVRVHEDIAHDKAPRIVARPQRQLFQAGEELVVDERQQLVAGHPLVVSRPAAPAQPFGDGRDVARADLVLLFFIVENLQEQHPDELRDALRVAVHARVLAHDVLDGFDQGGNGHVYPGTLPRQLCKSLLHNCIFSYQAATR